jgi:hypothetical protein
MCGRITASFEFSDIRVRWNLDGDLPLYYEEQWLDASRTPFIKAQSLLKPYPEELMNAHDVSQIVNSAKYDGPECIRPVSDDEMPRTGQLSLL